MALNIGSKLPNETPRSGVEAPPNAPVSIQERFAAAVAELPDPSRLALMPYGEGELDCRVDDAINDDNLEALKLLLDCGVKPDATHLRFAIYRDNREAAELLLERGVDPNGLWQHKHHVEKIIPCMELLVSHGADVAQFTAQYGPEINALSLKACAAADVDRVKELIICGADVNHCDDEDVTLLHITWLTKHHPDDQEQQAAVKRAKTAVVRLLCEKGGRSC
jgi:ankyrin repeat protein